MDRQQWFATNAFVDITIIIVPLIVNVDGPQRSQSNYDCMNCAIPDYMSCTLHSKKLIASKQSSNYQCIDSWNAQEIARLMLLNVFEYESGFVVKLYLNNIGHAILNFYLTFAERSSSCNNISNDLIYIDLSTFHMC